MPRAVNNMVAVHGLKLEIGKQKLGRDENRNWELERTVQKHEGQVSNFQFQRFVNGYIIWTTPL